MKLLALVPIQYRLTAIFLLIMAGIGYGWIKGANSELSKQQLINQNQVIHVLQTKVKQAEISERVVTQYVDRIKIVKQKAEVITKEVPVYVTQSDDSQCAIPDRFRLLWNAANTGEPPETARDTNAATNPIVLSDIAKQHSIEAEQCRETEQQLISLQEWVESIYKVQ